MRRLSMLACIIPVLLVLPVRAAIGQEREKIELRPALVVIDIQNEYMPMMECSDMERFQDNINQLMAMFREYGMPVFRVHHSSPDRGPEPGSEGFKYPEAFDTSDEDIVIVKTRGSSFLKTDLERLLREKDRNLVVLCGLSATGCVLATYYGSMERDFYTVMVQDAVISHKETYTKMIEDICNTGTIEEIGKILEDPMY
ncbi:MAG TPA: isochorismatase family protein [Candidatus Krumholzibacterium sp.]|nr:isochorismatase family protein [Candidatus Krumholzibacterium sp.]